MKTILKRMFTKDEIAGHLEALCKKDDANKKYLKKLIKLNTSKLFENPERSALRMLNASAIAPAHATQNP